MHLQGLFRPSRSTTTNLLRLLPLRYHQPPTSAASPIRTSICWLAPAGLVAIAIRDTAFPDLSGGTWAQEDLRMVGRNGTFPNLSFRRGAAAGGSRTTSQVLSSYRSMLWIWLWGSCRHLLYGEKRRRTALHPSMPCVFWSFFTDLSRRGDHPLRETLVGEDLNGSGDFRSALLGPSHGRSSDMDHGVRCALWDGRSPLRPTNPLDNPSRRSFEPIHSVSVSVPTRYSNKGTTIWVIREHCIEDKELVLKTRPLSSWISFIS